MNPCKCCGHTYGAHSSGPVCRCNVAYCTCSNYTQVVGDKPELVDDLVNHPPHYMKHPSGVECIQITEHMNFNVGNATKYIWRAGEKDGTSAVTDLSKARWYIDREITRLTREEPS